MSKTVIITGASGGIGKACAEKFAKEGFSVVINYNTSETEAKKLEEKLSKVSGVLSVKADVSNSEEAEMLAKKTYERFGKIDVLVNNAGIALKPSLFQETDEKETDRVLRTNIGGTLNMSKAVLPYMINEKSGAIVNVSSVWGVCGASCEVVYSTSKAAVCGFTKALSKEVAPSGIRVNAVAPGVIDTKMNAFLSESEKKVLEFEIPMGRWGTPEEIASVIYFLASDASSYITGQILTADGGFIGV